MSRLRADRSREWTEHFRERTRSVVSGPLTIDHRRCNELFLSLEKVITASEWDAASNQIHAFKAAMKRHFSVEEDVLFPALEAATPKAGMAIRVMTMEHVQMLHMIQRLAMAVEQRSKQNALGLSETLFMTIQQHIIKEENILYPMADRYVPEVTSRIARLMKE
ncbi:MAG: hemerythrin domain-containing protein [Candidatus Thiodiazotropha sp.]